MTAQVDQGAITPTIKNTFLDFKLNAMKSESPRRRSVPASTRLCKEGIADGEFFVSNLDSDASTDMLTDGSTCSDGVKTPVECEESFHEPAFGEICPPPPSPWELASTIAAPNATIYKQRLNTKASLFKPQSVANEPAKEHYKLYFLEVMTWAMNVLRGSENVANVELVDEHDGFNLIIQPRGNDREWQTESLLTLAKEVLLDSASKSRCVYLQGYCSPKPFVMKPQGFEATLAAMESPVTACWHIFKKGFCRHGGECSKMHPAAEVPVRVVVESVQLNSCSRFISAFKQEVADLTMAVIASLGEYDYTEKVEAFKDKDCQAWTIEVTTKQDASGQGDYALTMAKSALFNATNNSNTVYIMGYAAKPFMARSRGFVVMLGDMQDESVACWDLYSKGSCRHDCACRWQHPECLVPINVVVKDSFHNNPKQFPALAAAR
jgi:hypothetical protein